MTNSPSARDSGVLLSICIPTHNFGPFIGEALQSVLSQAGAETEVVVLDSASTDNTREVVETFQQRYENLKYIYADRKNGIDRDLAQVVSLARGEYCWLFSADDVMREGAVALLVNELDRWRPDLVLCMHSNNSLSMEIVHHEHPVLRLAASANFQLHERAQQRRYFSLALTTEAFFSFMSGLIVNRKHWHSVPLRDQFVGSNWAHVARLFELMQSHLHVRFLRQVLLARRGGNDSFARDGTVRRFAIAIEGFQDLAERFWGTDSFESRQIRRVLRNEFTLRMLFDAKVACALNPALESQDLLDQLVKRLYADGGVVSGVKTSLFHLISGRRFERLREVYRLCRPAS